MALFNNFPNYTGNLRKDTLLAFLRSRWDAKKFRIGAATKNHKVKKNGTRDINSAAAL